MMTGKYIGWIGAALAMPLLLASVSLPAASQEMSLDTSQRPAAQTAAASRLTCNNGPILRRYGGGPWLVYGCDDDRSVLLVTAADNPAAPFWFMFQWQESAYRLYGEGVGDKALTDAAYTDLRRLSVADITRLPARTTAP